MGERSLYNVNPKPKQNYFSFICSLLIFLSLLILIYVLSVYLRSKPTNTTSPYEKDKQIILSTDTHQKSTDDSYSTASSVSTTSNELLKSTISTLTLASNASAQTTSNLHISTETTSSLHISAETTLTTNRPTESAANNFTLTTIRSYVPTETTSIIDEIPEYTVDISTNTIKLHTSNETVITTHETYETRASNTSRTTTVHDTTTSTLLLDYISENNTTELTETTVLPDSVLENQASNTSSMTTTEFYIYDTTLLSNGTSANEVINTSSLSILQGLNETPVSFSNSSEYSEDFSSTTSNFYVQTDTTLLNHVETAANETTLKQDGTSENLDNTTFIKTTTETILTQNETTTIIPVFTTPIKWPVSTTTTSIPDQTTLIPSGTTFIPNETTQILVETNSAGTTKYSFTEITSTSDQTTSPVFNYTSVPTTKLYISAETTATTIETTETLATNASLTTKLHIPIEITSTPEETTTPEDTTINTLNNTTVIHRSNIPIETTIKAEETDYPADNTTVIPTTKLYVSAETTFSLDQTSEKSEELSVCENTRCKRFASEMLAGVNYMKDPCIDFYEYACGGITVREDNFKTKILDNILKELHRAPKPFQQFYESCIQFDSDFGSLNSSLIASKLNLTDLVVEMVLYQTMHFFDIGLEFGDDENIQFLISPLPQTTLKTTLERWSMLEKFKKQCDDRCTVNLTSSANLEDIEKTRDKINECLIKKIGTYTRRYANTMNFPYLPHHVDQLEQVIKIHIEQLRNPFISNKNITKININDFALKYTLKDINWWQVFNKLSDEMNEETVIQVQSAEYLEDFFKRLEHIDLAEVLHLWHHSQIYHNIIKEKSIHSERQCLEMAVEFFPDIAKTLSHTNLNSKENHDIILSVFNAAKMKLNGSLEKKLKSYSHFKEQLQAKLEKVSLVRLEDTVDLREADYEKLKLSVTDFQINLNIVIKNFRQRLFSLAGKPVNIGTVYQYFINPFNNKPKAFYTLNKIVYHPAYLEDFSKDIPEYVILAKIGYPLAIELFKGFLEDYENYPKYNILAEMQFKFDDSSYYGLNDNNARAIIKDLIVENAAYRLLTDLFEDKEYTTTIIFANPEFTISKMFAVFASQSFCSKGILEEKIFDFTVPISSSMIVRNTAKNSKFIHRTFLCEENNVYSAQFPYIFYIGQN